MNTTFSDIIIEVFEREGGFVNLEADRGGATKYGVTLKTMRRHNIDIDHDGDVDVADVKALPFDKAKAIYKNRYWDPSRAGEIPPELRSFYFDMCINHGQGTAVVLLQTAANNAGQHIAIDGIIGAQTIQAAAFIPRNVLIRERARYYCRIVEGDPSQIIFIEGWINRCFDFLIAEN